MLKLTGFKSTIEFSKLGKSTTKKDPRVLRTIHYTDFLLIDAGILMAQFNIELNLLSKRS